MRTKPKVLNYVAAFLVAMALGMPLQIMLLYGHSPLEVGAIAAKLAPLNWAIMILAPLCAWLVWRASPLLLAVAPTLTMIVVHNNWFVAEIGTDFSPLTAGLATGIYLAAMGTLVTREVRRALLNPDLRWWRTPSRLKAEIPLLIGNGEKQFYATTFDISEGGAFIPLGREASKYLPTEMPLKVGARCSLFFTLKQLCSIECEAEIVRAEPAHGAYPAGIGLRFVGLDREKRRILHDYVAAQMMPQGAAVAKVA